MLPYYKKLTLNYARGLMHSIKDAVYKRVGGFKMEYFKTPEPVKFCDIEKHKMTPIKEGEKWGELWDCAWFRCFGTLPEGYAAQDLAFIIDIAGEGCVFDGNGVPVRGLTNVTSTFDVGQGEPGKRVIPAMEIVKGNEFNFMVEGGCNDLFGHYKGGRIDSAYIAFVNRDIRALYYDYTTLLLLAESLSEKDVQRYGIIYALEKAGSALNTGFEKSGVLAAREILKKELGRKNAPNPPLQYYAIGHAHMDLAWLWPIRETRRKIGRTFANVLANMNDYPEYIFGASQPQQYQWLKEDYSELYEKFIKRVKEGRIEAQGAMWVESDTNVAGGEALVRQIMYGNKFFKDECGVTSDLVWLPDVFGFSAALPQIMKKSGIENFVTIKLSWSEFNSFPHNTFWWEGTDGSRVLVHMPPELNYNGAATPASINKATDNFAEKGIVDKAMIIYGIGDGGGGPNRSHLERLDRMKDILGLPPVKQATTAEYFKDLRENLPELRAFKGEMYLERHQGTYTTQAKNKKYNRLLENGLRAAELSCVLACNNGDYTYPKAELERIWKEVLLYQFHDILPGSSIKRVYDESVERYEILLDETNKIINSALGHLGKEKTVFNASPFARRELIMHENKWFEIDAPALSVAHFGKEVKNFNVCADGETIENEHLKAVFAADGKLVSLTASENGHETVTEGNRWQVYNDFGDAWDMNVNYRNSPAGQLKLISALNFNEGAKVGIVFKYEYGNSSFSEKVSLTHGARALEFEVDADWRESGKMLRWELDTAVVTDSVTCDIQFGNIKRPTVKNYSREFAQFEICAHKYIDVSNHVCGLSLINDCKYGFSAENNTLTMNVLRSTNYPGKDADIGRHSLRFALLPHSECVEKSGVAAYGYGFNNPLRVVSSAPKAFLSADKSNIIIETVKKAEEGADIVVRLYENNGENTACVLKAQNIASYCESDMTEKPVPFIKTEGKINLNFAPHEIKTLILRQ